MAKPLDSNRIVAEILAGQHDDKGNDIFQAVLKRSSETKARLRWRIRWEAHDLTVTEDDLTLDECMSVETFAKTPWHQIDPIESAYLAAAVLIITLNRRRDLSLEDATKQVGELGYRAVMDMVDKYIAEPSPLDQDGAVDVEGEPRPLP